MLDNLVCPISHVRIDRNAVRIGGALTAALLVTYVLTRQWWILVPLALDYALRARMSGPTSPMSHLARLLARTLGLAFRAADKAPKVFASRIGFCFATSASIAHFTHPTVAPWIAGALAFFATLESALDFCVGCVVYTYGALPLHRARAAVMSIPLFRKLDEPMLASVAEGFAAVELPAGALILTEGEPGAEMFVIRTGEVEVFHEREGGDRRVIATYKPRDHFGEMALLTGRARTASVRARTPVTLLRLTEADLEQVFEQHPGMQAILEKTAEERIAREARDGQQSDPTSLPDPGV